MNRRIRDIMAALGFIMIVLALAASIPSCGHEPKEIVTEVISTPEPTPSPTPSEDIPDHIVVVTTLSTAAESKMDSDLYWLARGMQEEDGIEWTDEDILKIGTVIANRKDDPRFPDTYKEVLLQEGQYQPFFDYVEGETELTKPDDRYIYLAGLIIEGYRSWDDPSVIWQACFFQGTEIVDTVYDPYLGSTTYFCK